MRGESEVDEDISDSGMTTPSDASDVSSEEYEAPKRPPRKAPAKAPAKPRSYTVATCQKVRREEPIHGARNQYTARAFLLLSVSEFNPTIHPSSVMAKRIATVLCKMGGKTRSPNPTQPHQSVIFPRPR